MDLKHVPRAKAYMDALANGIDPISGEVIPEGEVVRQERLMNCFHYISDVLEEVLRVDATKKQPSAEQPFQPHLLDYSGFSLSETPITISELVKRINDCRPEYMQKLKRTGVVNWLVEQRYIQRVEINGRSCVRLGERSADIGLSEETRFGEDGRTFTVVVYPKGAQQLILEHLAAIVQTETYAKPRGRANKGKPWTKDEEMRLQSLLEANTPIRDIAVELQRTQRAIEMRIEKMETNAQAKKEYENFDKTGVEKLGRQLTKQE